MSIEIINTTKNTILADKAELAETLWKRVVGLLGRKTISPGQGMVIRPCSDIHTFFMRFPIDAVFLGRDSKVVKVVRNMAPFRTTLPSFRAKCVIELPVGVISESHTKLGDIIEVRDTVHSQMRPKVME